ncbi:Ulp1-like peptidase [Cucumis melo var. makuwa]|uniref:Ulp1-like peptidase n=1 Tax=Cucumis melo var. makuwa TaxID=1194695 RepID=A0A5D3BP04_CUCMM|nr:Ulp1-like peptidase [Cucumis melo var. makuwa]
MAQAWKGNGLDGLRDSLWPTEVTLDKDYDNKRVQRLLLGSQDKKIITFLEVDKVFKHFGFTNDEDAVKVALALFIEIVMVGKCKKTQFDIDVLGGVDDEEVFKNFDCSTIFYTHLLNNLKTILQGKKEAYELKRARSSKAVAYYNIKGYMLAFQEDESMQYCNSSDTNTSANGMNNQSSNHDDLNNLRSTSSPLLQSNANVGWVTSTVQPSPQRKER